MVGKFKEKEKARKSCSFSPIFLGGKKISLSYVTCLSISIIYLFFPGKEPNIVNIFP